jgi:hypothetical protein
MADATNPISAEYANKVLRLLAEGTSVMIRASGSGRLRGSGRRLL